MDRETVLRLASEFTLVTKNMTEGVYVESLERFADACCAWQKEQDAVDCLNEVDHFVAKVGSALNEP